MRQILSGAMVIMLLLCMIPTPLFATQQLTNQTSTTILSNKDVLDLLRLKLSEEIIAAKIKSSNCNFDTSPVAIQELKLSGASDSIILAMIQAPKAAPIVAQSFVPEQSATPNAAVASNLVPVSTKREVNIPNGTPIEVELMQTLSSEEVEAGTPVNFTVVAPVKVNGVTVIERGAPARGRITEAQKARRWGRSGNLKWMMNDVTSTSGDSIPVSFTQGIKGNGSSGKVAIGMIATAVVIMPLAAPLWGFKKGGKATIPAGKRFTVFVSGDNTIKVQ
jgi:hypothetical protein